MGEVCRGPRGGGDFQGGGGLGRGRGIHTIYIHLIVSILLIGPLLLKCSCRMILINNPDFQKDLMESERFLITTLREIRIQLLGGPEVDSLWNECGFD